MVLPVVAACQPPAAAEPPAATCAIANVDLTTALGHLPGALGTLTVRATDPDSGEPILRTTVDAADGNALVVEQKNCDIRNLRVTLLAADPKPAPAALRRMAAALAATPLWQQDFAAADPLRAIEAELASPEFAKGSATGKPFDYATGRLQPAGEGGEVLVTFATTEAYAAQFRSALTLAFSIGGD